MFVLVVLPLLLAVGFLIAAVVSRQRSQDKADRYYSYNSFTPLQLLLTWSFIVFGVVFAVFSLWAAAGNASSAGTVSRMEAFYHDTLSTYEYTIDRTEGVVIVARDSLDGTLTDFTYEEQGKAVSQRIAELRDQIEQYNYDLRYLRRVNGWALFGDLWYDVPDDLKPIKLEV